MMSFPTMDPISWKFTGQPYDLNSILTPDQVWSKLDVPAEEVRQSLITLINALNNQTASSNIGFTPNEDVDPEANTIQTAFNALVTLLHGSGGAEWLKSVGVTGLTGDNVQSLLESLKTYIDDLDTTNDQALATHKLQTTNDHDGRYYTKTEVDGFAVKNTGDQTIAGVKTFSSSPIVPTPITDMQASTKKYVDDNFTTKNDITNNRKLSATGDFRGTLNGYPIVQADPGYSSMVAGINDTFNAHLADGAHYVTKYGADKTGVTPSGSVINNAIQAINAGESLYFPAGVYLIETPINWNKKISMISDGNVILKASAAIFALVHATGFTTYQEVRLDNIILDGNNLASNCLVLDGNNDNNTYITRCRIADCECLNAVLDGISIIPPAWDIVLENTMSHNNGRDGFRAITTNGAYQLNHIAIDDNCIFNNNVASGINIMGTQHSISKCDIEGNTDGIKIDMTQVTVGSYVSWAIKISSNYIESNRNSQINLKANAGVNIQVKVTDNYLNGPNMTGPSLIVCSGVSEGISLITKSNQYGLGSATNILDGGNSLSGSSLINETYYFNPAKYINLGFARVLWDYFQNIVLPATTAYGVSATDLNKTGNILSTSINFPVLVDVTEKLLENIFATVTSDCSAWTVRTWVTEVSAINGTQVRQTYFDTTGTNNGSIALAIPNNWGYTRIQSGSTLIISFQVMSNTGGTSLKLSNVVIKII